jgi:hypothetical protein
MGEGGPVDGRRPGWKRFAAFSWSEFDACGGWNDLTGFFDTQEEAAFMVTEYEGPRAGSWWWHVVDLLTGEVVARKEGGREE